MFLYLFRGGVPFALLALVNQVGQVVADHGLVGRDAHHLEAVDLVELLCFGGRGSGHAGQLLEHPEVVLQGDGGVGHALPLYLHAFLGLYGLVQPVGPAATPLHPSGELVDDHHLAVAHHVVLVPLPQDVGGEGVLDVVDQVEVFRIVNVPDLRPLLHLGYA